MLFIAVGLAALTFLWGFIDGMNRQVIRNTTRYFAGEVQVHVKGYHDDPTLHRAIDSGSAVLAEVPSDPPVAAITVRLETTVLARRANHSHGGMAFGLDVAADGSVIDLFKAIVDRQPFAGPADPAVLIGDRMAEALDLHAGDEIVLHGYGYHGSVGSARLPVRRVFRAKIDDRDGYVAEVLLPVMRDLLSAPDAVTAVVVRLQDWALFAEITAALGRRIGNRFEVVGRPVLLPMAAVSTRFHEVMGFVVLGIFSGIVVAGVVTPCGCPCSTGPASLASCRRLESGSRPTDGALGST